MTSARKSRITLHVKHVDLAHTVHVYLAQVSGLCKRLMGANKDDII